MHQTQKCQTQNKFVAELFIVFWALCTKKNEKKKLHEWQRSKQFVTVWEKSFEIHPKLIHARKLCFWAYRNESHRRYRRFFLLGQPVFILYICMFVLYNSGDFMIFEKKSWLNSKRSSWWHSLFARAFEYDECHVQHTKIWLNDLYPVFFFSPLKRPNVSVLQFSFISITNLQSISINVYRLCRSRMYICQRIKRKRTNRKKKYGMKIV